jgi:hypothetical protein
LKIPFSTAGLILALTSIRIERLAPTVRRTELRSIATTRATALKAAFVGRAIAVVVKWRATILHLTRRHPRISIITIRPFFTILTVPIAVGILARQVRSALSLLAKSAVAARASLEDKASIAFDTKLIDSLSDAPLLTQFASTCIRTDLLVRGQSKIGTRLTQNGRCCSRREANPSRTEQALETIAIAVTDLPGQLLPGLDRHVATGEDDEQGDPSHTSETGHNLDATE